MSRAQKLTVVVKQKGVRALLRSDGVAQDLTRRAERVQAKAGGETAGFKVTSKKGPNRARARVYASTHEARAAESEDRVLTRSISAGR